MTICERMGQSGPHFAEKIFGNSRWNVMLVETPGEFPFTTIGTARDGFLKKLFRLRLGPVGPVTGRRSHYRPDCHRVEWETPTGVFEATLRFPPERSGAVISAEWRGEASADTHVSLFTWNPADPASAPYADYDEGSACARFPSCGFEIGIRIRGDFPGGLRAAKEWQAVRFLTAAARSYQIFVAFGRNEREVFDELDSLESRSGGWPGECGRWWESYFASCPVVVPSSPLVAVAPSGRSYEVSPEDFFLRQLWLYYWALASVVDLPGLRATPLQVADRRTFNQSFSNDNTFGVGLLALTSHARTARQHLVNLITHLVDARGHVHWSMDADGECSTFRDPHGVPAIGHALGYYVRAAGDADILDEDTGGMTVWEKVRLMENRVLALRDVNGDGMCEWNHIWETGEDNKDSPFFRRKGLLEWLRFYEAHREEPVAGLPFYQDNVCPVTALNEQAFHLWSLAEMSALARSRGESPGGFEDKKTRILDTLRTRHWNEEDGFYYDFDVREGKLWTARNLDAFYCLAFEKDASRVARMLDHLFNPNEFGLELFPSLSRNEAGFDPESYWAGAAWPREQGFVAISLARQGFRRRAFETMVHVLMSEGGIDFAETVNPLNVPVRPHAPIIMTMCAVNQVILLSLCGGVEWSAADEPARDGDPSVRIVPAGEVFVS